MQKASVNGRDFRFGPFSFAPGTGELRKRGIKIKLNGQAVQVLTALLENAGQLISREELRSKLWPEGTFVDFDHSLNAVVNRLRQRLGDSAESPCYIETIPGRGYRFIAPVRAAQPSAAAAVDPEPEPAGHRRYHPLWIAIPVAARRLRTHRNALLLVAGLFAVIGAAFWLHIHSPPWMGFSRPPTSVPARRFGDLRPLQAQG